MLPIYSPWQFAGIASTYQHCLFSFCATMCSDAPSPKTKLQKLQSVRISITQFRFHGKNKLQIYSSFTTCPNNNGFQNSVVSVCNMIWVKQGFYSLFFRRARKGGEQKVIAILNPFMWSTWVWSGLCKRLLTTLGWIYTLHRITGMALVPLPSCLPQATLSYSEQYGNNSIEYWYIV